MPNNSSPQPTQKVKLPIPFAIVLLLMGWGLSGCANTAWGQRLEQALSIPSPLPTGETPRKPPQETPLPGASPAPTPESAASATPSPTNTPASDFNNTQEPTPSPLSTAGAIGPTPLPRAGSPTGSATGAGGILSGDLPESLRTAVQPVLALGVLTVPTTPVSVWDQPVTRRQFARWLFTVNNRLYADRPGQQIRGTSTNAIPTFRDIPTTDPDFTLIQGLAEAGILPSPLRGNATVTQFRPEAPLTREQMVLWKVPLDARQSLPTATIDRIAQTWNFQDSAQISGEALGAVVLDFQNGELSNIRRVFGYTTLFQPQKAVTQGEAIVALAYFGFQGQGVFAANPPSQ